MHSYVVTKYTSGYHKTLLFHPHWTQWMHPGDKPVNILLM